VTLSFGVAATLEDFSEAARQELADRLSDLLSCYTPNCQLYLAVTAASVRVVATLVIPNTQTLAGAQAVYNNIALRIGNFTALPPEVLSSVLGVNVSAAVTVAVDYNSTTTIAVAPPPPPGVPSTKDSSAAASASPLILAIVLGAVVLVALVVASCLFRRHFKRLDADKRADIQIDDEIEIPIDAPTKPRTRPPPPPRPRLLNQGSPEHEPQSSSLHPSALTFSVQDTPGPSALTFSVQDTPGPPAWVLSVEPTSKVSEQHSRLGALPMRKINQVDLLGDVELGPPPAELELAAKVATLEAQLAEALAQLAAKAPPEPSEIELSPRPPPPPEPFEEVALGPLPPPKHTEGIELSPAPPPAPSEPQRIFPLDLVSPREFFVLNGSPRPHRSLSPEQPSHGDPISDHGDPISDRGDPISERGDPISDHGDPISDRGDPILDHGDQPAPSSNVPSPQQHPDDGASLRQSTGASPRNSIDASPQLSTGALPRHRIHSSPRELFRERGKVRRAGQGGWSPRDQVTFGGWSPREQVVLGRQASLPNYANPPAISSQATPSNHSTDPKCASSADVLLRGRYIPTLTPAATESAKCFQAGGIDLDLSVRRIPSQSAEDQRVPRLPLAPEAAPTPASPRAQQRFQVTLSPRPRNAIGSKPILDIMSPRQNAASRAPAAQGITQIVPAGPEPIQRPAPRRPAPVLAPPPAAARPVRGPAEHEPGKPSFAGMADLEQAATLPPVSAALQRARVGAILEQGPLPSMPSAWLGDEAYNPGRRVGRVEEVDVHIVVKDDTLYDDEVSRTPGTFNNAADDGQLHHPPDGSAPVRACVRQCVRQVTPFHQQVVQLYPPPAPATASGALQRGARTPTRSAKLAHLRSYNERFRGGPTSERPPVQTPMARSPRAVEPPQEPSLVRQAREPSNPLFRTLNIEVPSFLSRWQLEADEGTSSTSRVLPKA
jgi:hypothetical protein